MTLSMSLLAADPILDHHIYDKKSATWIKRPSKPQPFLKLGISIHPEDYVALGIPPKVQKRVSASLYVMADTGCMSCLIGLKLLRRIGLHRKHLTPCSMAMEAANNGSINIIGSVVVRLTGQSPTGETLETRQILYVSDNTNKLFLSEEACEDLGLVSPDFPFVGSHPGNAQADSVESTDAPCDCPRRGPQPQIPTELPFPATKANRKRLEQWLLEYYSSTAFNTCTHQPLNLMKTPMMCLMINERLNPVFTINPFPSPSIGWTGSRNRSTLMPNWV